MTSQSESQYAPGYAKPQVRHHEWRTAENSAAHLIPHLKALAASNPQLQVLDVGAGSGTISASLAGYLAPSSRLVATDISDEILQRARQHAEAKGVADRMEFRTADVFRLPFPDGAFDVVHAHQVLCHLGRPWDAVAELVRVAKPGGKGIVALRETDMRTWCFWPELPPLERFQGLMETIIVANGGHDRGGRQLLSWALRAGVPRASIDTSFGTWCYAAAEDREAWSRAMIERLRAGQMRTKALEDGLATEQEIKDMISAWEEWRDRDDAVFALANGELIIHKP